jgi:uncharacterized membrane protein HdeD (DUF308 family)
MTMTTAAIGLPKWALITFGLLSVVAGIMALVWPGVTVLVLVVLLGIQLIIYGVVAMMRAFETGQGRILTVIFGVLAILAGTSLWLRPLRNLGAVVVVISVFWVAGGLVQTIGAIVDRDRHWGFELVMGLVSVAAGIVAIAWPGITLLAIAVMTGVWMIVIGLTWLVAGFRGGSGAAAMAT